MAKSSSSPRWSCFVRPLEMRLPCAVRPGPWVCAPCILLALGCRSPSDKDAVRPLRLRWGLASLNRLTPRQLTEKQSAGSTCHSSTTDRCTRRACSSIFCIIPVDPHPLKIRKSSCVAGCYSMDRCEPLSTFP